MKPIGWVYMPFISVTYGINNPRPEFLRAHGEGKQGTMHYVTGTRKSLCEKAIYMSGFLTLAGTSTAFSDIEDIDPLYKNNALICEKCLEKVNANNEVHDSE